MVACMVWSTYHVLTRNNLSIRFEILIFWIAIVCVMYNALRQETSDKQFILVCFELWMPLESGSHLYKDTKMIFLAHCKIPSWISPWEVGITVWHFILSWYTLLCQSTFPDSVSLEQCVPHSVFHKLMYLFEIQTRSLSGTGDHKLLHLPPRVFSQLQSF